MPLALHAVAKAEYSLYYPIPWLFLVFAPAIVVSKVLSRRYEVQGTSKTAPAEEACANVYWLSIFGTAIVLFYLLFLWIAIIGAGLIPETTPG